MHLLAESGERGLNLGWLCSDRHVLAGRGDHRAFLFVDPRGDGGESTTATTAAMSYATLASQSSRFAHLLGALGLARGSHVFSLLGRKPALYVAALGTWKAHGVFSPLFTAFGPEPLVTRLSLGRAQALVTTPSLYARKIKPWRDRLPSLRHVLLIDDHFDSFDADDHVAATEDTAHGKNGASESRSRSPREGTAALTSESIEEAVLAHTEGAIDVRAALRNFPKVFDVGTTADDELALLHFTSGTTGRPKGALHVHGAVVMHHLTGRCVLDLRDDDIYWCTADPGWVTGVSYGIVAPLSCGVTTVVDDADFDAERWYRILSSKRVNVWYTAPTAIRLLMRAGTELPKRFDLSALRFAGSVGEPLNPEAVWWSHEHLGHPFHDNWWQTETGGIMIANVVDEEIHPGSMGRPVPGVRAAIVRPWSGESGPRHIEFQDDGVEGELALRSGWPSMFRGYLGDDERYQSCFIDGWYLTGDLAKRDTEGRYWFVGRTDDVIKTSGHLVGPFEVESALLEHGAVVEAAVIGKPDPVAGQIVKAFVVLRKGQTWSEALRLDLLGFLRVRLGPVLAPREIDVVLDLPRTRSGKILRRLLRARELGLPEGDVSSLEAPQS
jgi:acetyl-CoA synthetase